MSTHAPTHGTAPHRTARCSAARHGTHARTAHSSAAAFNVGVARAPIYFLTNCRHAAEGEHRGRARIQGGSMLERVLVKDASSGGLSDQPIGPVGVSPSAWSETFRNRHARRTTTGRAWSSIHLWPPDNYGLFSYGPYSYGRTRRTTTGRASPSIATRPLSGSSEPPQRVACTWP